MSRTVATSQAQKIRDAFERMGPVSMEDCARYCMTYDIFTFEERERFELLGATAVVRKALKQIGADGLPFAGQTTIVNESGTPLWSVRQFWLFDDYALNIKQLRSEAGTLTQRASRLEDECVERFGIRPEGVEQ